MGLFDRMLAPTDHVDDIVSAARAEQQRISTERYHQRRANDVAGSNAYVLEKRKHSATEQELTKEKQKNQTLEEENVRLRQEKEKLEKAAVKLAVDRRALINTLGYLSQKWTKTEEQAQFEHDAQKMREEEAEKMLKDKTHVENVRQDIQRTDDNFAPHRSKINQKKK